LQSVTGTPKSSCSTEGALIGTSPIISTSSAGNFPAYIRTKHSEYVSSESLL
jgi:hypothetical protein